MSTFSVCLLVALTTASFLLVWAYLELRYIFRKPKL